LGKWESGDWYNPPLDYHDQRTEYERELREYNIKVREMERKPKQNTNNNNGEQSDDIASIIESAMVNKEKGYNIDKNTGICDSGASCHMIKTLERMYGLQDCNEDVKIEIGVTWTQRSTERSKVQLFREMGPTSMEY
jgi:hypothetical protein